MNIVMNKAVSFLCITTLLCVGCSKSSTSAPTAGVSPEYTFATDSPVLKKLQELAGARATNCGDLKSQAADQMNAASKCALQAVKEKRPFYVNYELPGMNVAIAGSSDGKLFAVQSQTGGAGLVSGACPAELRIAPSGRLTCYAPGTFPMGAGAGSHSTMSMPPAMGGSSGQNPHQGLAIPPPGNSNPHLPANQPPAKRF